MPTSTAQRNLVRRLIRRRERECTPGRKPEDPRGRLLDRFYVDAREAMALAQEEARGFNHSSIGTEHLLLGLLRAEHGPAARLLTGIGADLGHIRASIEALVGKGEHTQVPPLPVTPRLKQVLELARQEAHRVHSTHVRSEHVLLGLTREGGGLAARLLAELGVAYEHLRRRVDRAALACSFCGRSGLDAIHLVTGPNVCICERCIDEASRLAAQDAGEPAHASLNVVDQHRSASCSFCGKQRAVVDRLIAGPTARICSACLALCREIEDEERATLHLDQP
ncbi:MAG: hypothetical protein JOZ41_01305 [Chloroflexi bacterium]|nr:hypothetical protein [Chloroflexota bacterium]